MQEVAEGDAVIIDKCRSMYSSQCGDNSIREKMEVKDVERRQSGTNAKK